MELAQQLPRTVRLDGIDISSVYFPASHLPNVHCSINSVTRMPLDWSNQFDFVQQRTLFEALRSFEWLAAISEIFRVTKPGGSVQFLEAAPTEPKEPGLVATTKAW